MDQAFESGMPFWKETEYELRIKSETPQPKVSSTINQMVQNLLLKRIMRKKQKKDIAEELVQISATMKNLISKFRDKYYKI